MAPSRAFHLAPTVLARFTNDIFPWVRTWTRLDLTLSASPFVLALDLSMILCRVLAASAVCAWSGSPPSAAATILSLSWRKKMLYADSGRLGLSVGLRHPDLCARFLPFFLGAPPRAAPWCPLGPAAGASRT